MAALKIHDIPKDVLMDILTILPVKSLKRFSCPSENSNLFLRPPLSAHLLKIFTCMDALDLVSIEIPTITRYLELLLMIITLPNTIKSNYIL
ncbi:hypothetical protein HS088_TW04G01304 [Tripterygium wilfordii]|uniref:F-box domain-containing protein n=1 Tax=Tripterygium wilfordii TaxID=458696 RepID=A0A7J7DT76_TRIWF|nr:hypothetical protein HS088_TW04G01304 [Tripterygium wilfordii]